MRVRVETIIPAAESVLDVKRENWGTLSPEDLVEAIVVAIDLPHGMDLIDKAIEESKGVREMAAASAAALMAVLNAAHKHNYHKIIMDPSVAQALQNFAIANERWNITTGNGKSVISDFVEQTGNLPGFIRSVPPDVVEHIMKHGHVAPHKASKVRNLMAVADNFCSQYAPMADIGRVVVAPGKMVLQVFKGKEFDTSRHPREFDGFTIIIQRDIDPGSDPVVSTGLQDGDGFDMQDRPQ